MFIIGITGGSGTGKTAALHALKSLGVLALDCDAVYHELLSSDGELKTELAERFKDVLRDGAIDRKLLSEIAFTDPSALRDLNAITHKYISAEIDLLISGWAARGGTAAAIEAIALIESGKAKSCNVVVGVSAQRETRISRIIKRDGITREQAEKRVNAQKPDGYYIKNCDHILESNCTRPAEFVKKCKLFFSALLQEQGIETSL